MDGEKLMDAMESHFMLDRIEVQNHVDQDGKNRSLPVMEETENSEIITADDYLSSQIKIEHSDLGIKVEPLEDGSDTQQDGLLIQPNIETVHSTLADAIINPSVKTEVSNIGIMSLPSTSQYVPEMVICGVHPDNASTSYIPQIVIPTDNTGAKRPIINLGYLDNTQNLHKKQKADLALYSKVEEITKKHLFILPAPANLPTAQPSTVQLPATQPITKTTINNPNVITVRKNIKSSKSNLQCDICNIYCLDNANLKIHYKVKHNKFSYTCEECSREFETMHEKNSHNCFKGVKCPDCLLVFDTEEQMEDHLHTDHKQIRANCGHLYWIHRLKFLCNLCKKKLPNQFYKMGEHLFKMHRTRKMCFQCPLCKQLYPCDYGFFKHLETSHVNAKLESNIIYVCKSETMLVSEELTKRMENYRKKCTTANEESKAVEKVGTKNESSKKVEVAKKDKTNENLVITTPCSLPLRRFNCAKCKTKLENAENALAHAKSTHLLDIPCLYCTQSFKDSIELNSHLSSTHFICCTCNIHFPCIKTYTVHSENHESGLLHRFECPVCNLTFPLVKLTKQHLIERHPSFAITTQSLSEMKQEAKLNIHYTEAELKEMNMKQCDYCWHLEKSESDLFSHLKLFHRIYLCDNCKCLNHIINLASTVLQCIYCCYQNFIPKVEIEFLIKYGIRLLEFKDISFVECKYCFKCFPLPNSKDNHELHEKNCSKNKTSS